MIYRPRAIYVVSVPIGEGIRNKKYSLENMSKYLFYNTNMIFSYRVPKMREFAMLSR